MMTSSVDARGFDLTPDAGIRLELGAINSAHWRCIAKPLDKSIDGFLNSVAGGHPSGLGAGARDSISHSVRPREDLAQTSLAR